MVVDVKRLIQQIAERPPLWDRRCNEYCQKPVVSRLWKEIASSHSVHEAKVRKRWKALRDQFRQQVRKKPSEVKWPYYKDMLFLKSQFHTAKQIMEQPKVENYSEGILEHCSKPEVILEDDFQDHFNDQDPVMGMDYSTVDVDSSRGIGFRNLDDDYHFLLSLLPAMRRVPENQKFLFRIKLMEFFNKEIYQ